MKKYKYRFIQVISGILLLAAMFISCEDFLNEVPGDKITPDQHYKIAMDATISKRGAYSILQEVMPNLVIMNDLRSDLLTETENYDEDLRKINRHDIDINNKYNDPSGYYRIIINANEVLNNLWNINKYDRDYDSAWHSLDVIDMVSLRSWAYLTLVRLYGEAAYIPQNMNSFNENYQFEYYSKERMIDTLLSHLNPEFTYPDRKFNDEWEPLGLYERAVRGELYLEKGDYNNAYKYLKNAIGDADIRRYKLEEYIEEDWKNIFIYSPGQYTEVMSTITFSYEDNQENPLADIFYANRRYLAKPANYIVDLFSNQITVRGDSGDIYRGAGISYAYSEPGQKLMVNKYSIDPIEESGADIIIYRAADLHLLLAEALNQMGYHEAALAMINQGLPELESGWSKVNGIRYRANLTLKEMPTENVKNAVEDIIMEERALELAFEGKRWFDLVRVANRRGEDYLVDKIMPKYENLDMTEEEKDAIRAKLSDKTNWYLPFRK